MYPRWQTKPKVDDLLTQEQVEQLPRNTLVSVIWSGGNGPHVYMTDRDRWGQCVFHAVDRFDFLHYPQFVGKEECLTRITLI